MSDIKLPRLLAAAKEFNIGQDTLIEFLVKKGFSKDELKPTIKLSEPMYLALQAEFQQDKAIRSKADQVEIPKGTFANDPKKKEKPAEATTAAKNTADGNKLPLSDFDTIKSAPKVWGELVEEAVQPEPQQPKAEQPAAPIQEAAPSTKEAVQQPETQEDVKAEPLIEGPKVITKIDLSAIDSSTRPKKGSKKKEEAPKPEVTEKDAASEPVQIEKPVEEVAAAVAKSEVVAEEQKPAAEATSTQTEHVTEQSIPSIEKTAIPEEPVTEEAKKEEATGPVIENIEVDRITGPKILGKISLPVDSDTRPKASPASKDDKKRKRIPLNKVNPNEAQKPDAQRPQFGNRNQGPNQGQGGGNYNNNNNNQRNQQQGNRPQHGGGQQNRFGSGGGQQQRVNRKDKFIKAEPKEIDAKEIQDKIRETQAKLAGATGRGKSLKAKYRKAKREDAAEMAGNEQGSNILQVTEFITVSELAGLMDVNFAEIIGKCMGLGIMVSINQRLDAEVIELVASEFGYEVQFIGVDDAEDEAEVEDELEDDTPRPPIVTIMGHVDHGKTSLLDYIRNANVVAGEAGGITQHIGAYEVTLASGKKITFLDTPGHEAFTAMRARGAKVTDIAVIVVAADDAVMPQTKEAISHAQAAGVPMIFAVNKIDKDGANPQKIYEQLSQMNILVEEWGGKYQSQEIAAKKGLNIDLLLEKILLEAELLDLKANPEKDATGTIIEASLDKGRGYVATILVQNGTLRVGDTIVSGQHSGRIKAMFNERNLRVDDAPPSTPVVILGLNGAPQAGEKFKVYQDEAEAKEVANKRAQILREQGLRSKKHITLDEIGRRLALGNFKELNIIIKGDVDGSVEALSDSLQKLSTEEIVVRVVHKAVGQISESDVLLATASDAILIGFNVRPSAQANKLAQNEGVEIKMYSIIYNAIEEVKSAMEGMLEPKIQEKEVATIEIREVFKFDKATVAGCFVTEGKVKRDAKIRVYRDGILLYPRQEGAFAELGSLKRYKDDAKEVLSGMECGLTLKNYSDIAIGDTLICYEEEEIKRTL